MKMHRLDPEAFQLASECLQFDLQTIIGRRAAPSSPARSCNRAGLTSVERWRSLPCSPARKTTDRSRNSWNIAGENWFHALATPPPMMYMGRLNALIKLASAIPRTEPTSLKIWMDAVSPACAQAWTDRALRVESILLRASARHSERPSSAAAVAMR